MKKLGEKDIKPGELAENTDLPEIKIEEKEKKDPEKKPVMKTVYYSKHRKMKLPMAENHLENPEIKKSIRPKKKDKKK